IEQHGMHAIARNAYSNQENSPTHMSFSGDRVPMKDGAHPKIVSAKSKSLSAKYRSYSASSGVPNIAFLSNERYSAVNVSKVALLSLGGISKSSSSKSSASKPG